MGGEDDDGEVGSVFGGRLTVQDVEALLGLRSHSANVMGGAGPLRQIPQGLLTGALFKLQSHGFVEVGLSIHDSIRREHTTRLKVNGTAYRFTRWCVEEQTAEPSLNAPQDPGK